MKDEKISLRCSIEEKEKIRQEAEKYNLSISNYMVKKACYGIDNEIENKQKIIFEHVFYNLFNELREKRISRKKYIKKMQKELKNNGVRKNCKR